MAQYTYINSNMTVFKNVLEASGYFDTVTIENNVITCKVDTQTVFVFGYRYNGDTADFAYFNVYGVTASFQSGNYAPADMKPMYAYQCSGGLSIIVSSGRRIVITMNQNDAVTIVFGSGSGTTAAANMATIGAIAATDGGTYSNYNTNQNLSQQTLLIPVCTCAAFDTESYTVTAMIAAFKQFNTFCFITYDGTRYLFDGYFAVEDTETIEGNES